MSDNYQIVSIPLNQHELHTIITALQFRADMWESDIAGSDKEAAENSRDLDLIEMLEKFKTE